MTKRKHSRASKTKSGQRALSAEISILNGMIGVLLAPVNPVIFQFFASLPFQLTSQIQNYLPFLIFPFIILIFMLYTGKEKKTATLVAIPTIAMVGIYTFTNNFFISIVAPQAAISQGIPATILFPYITIAISSLLIVFGIFLLRK